jgi:hypothetical protein
MRNMLFPGYGLSMDSENESFLQLVASLELEIGDLEERPLGHQPNGCLSHCYIKSQMRNEIVN